MKIKTVLILVVALAFSACAPKSEVEKAQAESAELTKKVVQLERTNQEQRQRIDSLESAVKLQLGKLAAAQQQLERKPPMPVKVSLRKALLGGGYVAVFSTTIKQDFPVLVTVRSKALGTSKQFRVNLISTQTTDLGRNEGLHIEPEDEVFIENSNYENAILRFQK